jgi:predicted exporter
MRGRGLHRFDHQPQRQEPDMATNPPPGTLDFLRQAPAPVVSGPAVPEDPADRLPQSVVDQVMRLPGIDGVWIEREPTGARIVVLHYTPRGPTGHLPKTVHGLPTRIVGGEPIRAGL